MAMLDPKDYIQEYPTVKFTGVDPGKFKPNPLQDTLNRLMEFQKAMANQKVDTKIEYTNIATDGYGVIKPRISYMPVDTVSIGTPIVMPTKASIQEDLLSNMAQKHGFEFSLDNLSNQVILFKRTDTRQHKWAMDNAFWASLSPSATVEVIEEWLVKIGNLDEGMPKPIKRITIPKAWRVSSDDVL